MVSYIANAKHARSFVTIEEIGAANLSAHALSSDHKLVLADRRVFAKRSADQLRAQSRFPRKLTPH